MLQSPDVAYRGQPVALVVAETLETAREAAGLVRVDYDASSRTTSCSRPSTPGCTRRRRSTPRFPTDTAQGDFDAALRRRAPSRSTPPTPRPSLHNNPMEPHATIAVWDGDGRDALRLHPGRARRPARRSPRCSAWRPSGARDRRRTSAADSAPRGRRGRNAVLAALGAKVAGRPVKLAVTRQQMFALTGYRTPTIQRLRLGADRDGRLQAIAHDVVEQTSTVRGVRRADRCRHPRMMYAAPHRRTTPPAGRARRPDALVDARAGRVPRHVRARVGDGRAGRRAAASTRSSCASATSPTSTPRRASRSAPATWWRACARAPSASAGPAATRARAARAAG